MTAKEKAEELVDSFYNIDSDSEMFDGFTMPIFYAQRCALISADEILGYMGADRGIEFWQEVKIEIEKL